MGHDIFISYSTKDKEVANAVCTTLESRGLKCWLAPRNITPGADWGASIVHAISKSRVMVLIFSSNANQSKQIKREVNLALDKNVHITPFRIEDVMPSEALEYYLDVMHWLDALTPPLEQHIHKLADAINTLIGPVITETAPKIVEVSRPPTVPVAQDEPEEIKLTEESSKDVVEPRPVKPDAIAVNRKTAFLADIRERFIANGFACQENVQFNGQVFALVATDKTSPIKLKLTSAFLVAEFPHLTNERLEEFIALCRNYLDSTAGGSLLSSLFSKGINFVIPVAIAQAVDESTLYSVKAKNDFITTHMVKKYGTVFPVIYSVPTGTLHYYEGYGFLNITNLYFCRDKVKKCLGEAQTSD